MGPPRPDLWRRLQGSGVTATTAIQIQASMGGFVSPAIDLNAGRTGRIELASLDTPFHGDGGRQFVVDELGIDLRVGPRSSEVFELTAPSTAGTHTWHCDICCGGRENPSMQGGLMVTACCGGDTPSCAGACRRRDTETTAGDIMPLTIAQS